MSAPYWSDGRVTLYHGDCREVAEWLAADVLVTDPPYGRAWRQVNLNPSHRASSAHGGISNDDDTSVRDAALLLWGSRLGIVFGHLSLAPPPGTKHVAVSQKAPGSGQRWIVGGFRRDIEAVYLTGPWPVQLVGAGRSSVLGTGARSQVGRAGVPGRYGHPHAKPVDVMKTLTAACPPGVIADPFAGSGSTLIAARNQGRDAIGAEIEERYCEMAARRLSQGVLEAS